MLEPSRLISKMSLAAFAKLHEQNILTAAGVAATIGAAYMRKRAKHRSNNWLKLHGKPMRRRMRH